VSFLANGETASKIAWSPDGHYLLFDTAQRSEQVQIARVDLLPHVPKYREDEFRELFRPSKTPGTPSSPNAPPATPAVPTSPAEEKPVAVPTPPTQAPQPPGTPVIPSAFAAQVASTCLASNVASNDFCNFLNGPQSYNGVNASGPCCTATEVSAAKALYSQFESQNRALVDIDHLDCLERFRALLCKPCSIYRFFGTCGNFCEGLKLKCFRTATQANPGASPFTWTGVYDYSNDTGQNIYPDYGRPLFTQWGCSYCDWMGISGDPTLACSGVPGNNQCYNSARSLSVSTFLLVAVAVFGVVRAF